MFFLRGKKKAKIPALPFTELDTEDLWMSANNDRLFVAPKDDESTTGGRTIYQIKLKP